MTKIFFIFIILSILLAIAGAAEMKAADAKKSSSSLIPRNLLFGNPDRIITRISPHGASLSFLARRALFWQITPNPI